MTVASWEGESAPTSVDPHFVQSLQSQLRGIEKQSRTKKRLAVLNLAVFVGKSRPLSLHYAFSMTFVSALTCG